MSDSTAVSLALLATSASPLLLLIPGVAERVLGGKR